MNGRTWSPEIKEIGNRISALTAVQAAELGDYLEGVHGVQAAALVVKPDVVVKEEVLPPAPPTEFDVIYQGYDPASKIPVIRLVRELTGMGLREARDLVDGAPRVFKSGLAREDAERLKARLEAAGAKAALQGS
jgi:large subunit ribosomal protein L7/L12